MDTQSKHDIVAGLDTLLSAPDYVALRKLKPEFNLFDFLGSLNENATSQALAFLLDSDQAHGFGGMFVEHLLEEFYQEAKQRGFELAHRLALQAHSVSVVTEWLTTQGDSQRRLDLLVKLSDESGNLKHVFGIENKHGAPELPAQIADYQSEISRRYPAIEKKLIFFLTPTGRESFTQKAEAKP